MSEEANESVDQEIEAVAQPTESGEHNDVSQEAQEAQQKKRNDAEFNFAEMRRARERDRAEMEALRRELESLKPKAAPSKDEDDIGIQDEELVEGRHMRLLKKELRELKAEMNKRESSMLEERLHTRYSDIETVLSPENIELAKKLEPELIESISEMKDPYKKGVAAYKLVTRLVKEQGNSVERKKVAENSSKPVSVNAITKNSALGNAHLFENGLTPELKASLWKEMQQAAKAS